MGENALQRMFSQMLQAMKREIPDPPKPHPLVRTSSSIMTMTPAKVSWIMMRMAFPAPRESTSPYWPDQTVAKPSKRAITKPRTIKDISKAKFYYFLLTFLCTVEQSTVFLGVLVNFDELGSGKELHDHTTGNDRGDTEFHKGTSVRGKDDTHPVERITSDSLGNTIKGHLAADQVHKEDDSSPHSSSLEWDKLDMLR